MPQPATHYLVTRFAIPEEYYSTWWDPYKQYFGLGSCAPDFFYFPLMPKKVIGDVKEDLSWENIANPLHSSNSYDMFCNLLAVAKQTKMNASTLVEEKNANKQFAFSFGYCCHVVTDCIFHPYVYRSTGDLWHTTDKTAETLHKQQELFIDNELYRKYYSRDKIYKMSVTCSEESTELLDFSIAKFFAESLKSTYPDCLPKEDIEISTESETHPIQQAYKALIKTIPFLFESTKICLWGSKLSIDINISDLVSNFSNNFLTSPYENCPSLPEFSPNDLFHFSIIESYKIFNEALKFWNSDSDNPKNFFHDNPVNYLDAGNFNLDTGLPSNCNNYKLLRSIGDEHYSFMADILTNNYNYFKLDYQNFDKSILENKQLL